MRVGEGWSGVVRGGQRWSGPGVVRGGQGWTGPVGEGL